ncbi:hypothetical protein [Rhizobium rhizosphaerae]|uniref:hypothetical protein n=1 Tax=Xaviernesmea rhizosphaerae TaxID=1672749 RepID=UPI000AED72A8|nr:hypothetical protein [Xaviernesmea rhizosphaerae]
MQQQKLEPEGAKTDAAVLREFMRLTPPKSAGRAGTDHANTDAPVGPVFLAYAQIG